MISLKSVYLRITVELNVSLCLLLNRTVASLPLRPLWTQATRPSFTLQSSTNQDSTCVCWTTWLRTGHLSTGLASVPLVVDVLLSYLLGFLVSCLCIFTIYYSKYSQNIFVKRSFCGCEGHSSNSSHCNRWILISNHLHSAFAFLIENNDYPVVQFSQWQGRDRLHRVPVSRREWRRRVRRDGEDEGGVRYSSACQIWPGANGGCHPLTLLDGEQDQQVAAVQGRRYPPKTPAGLRHASALLLQASLLPEKQ